MRIPCPLTVGSLALCLALQTASPGAATTARITALGGCGDYFTDDANVQRWCAVLAEYPDLVVIQTGWFDLTDGYDDQWGRTQSGPGAGLHAALDRAGTWGVVGLFLNGRESDADPGSLQPGRRQDSVAGIYARRFGGWLAGARIGRAAGDEGEPGSFNWTSTRTDLGAGFRIPLGSGAVVDVAGDLRGITHDLPLPELDSWDNLGLRARAFVRLDERTALVPLLEYVREEGGGYSIEGNLLIPAEREADLRRVGIGLNFFPDLDNFLLLTVDYLDGDLDVPTGGTGLFSLRMGFETRLNPWLTARASAGYDHWSGGEDSGVEQDNHIPLSLGLSAYAARVALDVALSDRRPGSLSRRLVPEDPGESATWLTITLRYGFMP